MVEDSPALADLVRVAVDETDPALAELDHLPLSPSARGWVAYTRGELCQEDDPQQALAYFAAFRGLWAIFIHANVRLSIGPLRMLLGALLREAGETPDDRERAADERQRRRDLVDREPGHEGRDARHEERGQRQRPGRRGEVRERFPPARWVTCPGADSPVGR